MNIPLTPLRCIRYAEKQFSGNTAVVCGGDRFTYKQFAERVGRLAGGLRSTGIEAGDRVAFLSVNCHRLLEAYYGVPDAGGVILPLNIRLSPGELTYVLNDSGAKVLFLEQQFLGLVDSFRQAIPSVKAFVLLDASPQASWLAKQNYEEILAAAVPYRTDIMSVDENSLAELFYTSGTSANPKGVMLTHRNVYLHALNACMAFDVKREHVQLHTIPLFHANGWGIAHTLTLRGGKHVMLRTFDPQEVFRLIEREHVRAFGLVPTMAAALVNSPERQKYDLSSLLRICVGGSAPSPTILRELEEQVGGNCFGGYGLTEASPLLTISDAKLGQRWEGEARYVGQAKSGYAIPGGELRLVDADEKDLPHDGKAVGEVIARSDGVMAGYWQQPQATAEVMRGGWFHTGDMATIDENEYVLLVDRKKDIIISGGENISSLEIESVLSAHPAVYELAVIPVPDEKWGEVPKALVVLKPGSQATEQELIEFCRARITHYKAPRSVEFMASLPKTGTGKILKKELRKKYWGGQDTIRPEFAPQKPK